VNTTTIHFSDIFDRLVNAGKAVEFNTAWANGTGYFDHVVCNEHAPKLEAGDMICFIDASERRGIILGLPKGLGNIVVFERFTRGENGVLTFNSLNKISKSFGFQGKLSDEQVEFILGNTMYGDENLSERITRLLP